MERSVEGDEVVKVIMGFPCFNRMGTQQTHDMVEKLIQTDVHQIICGCTPEEYDKYAEDYNKYDGRFLILPIVQGIGCGGDMRAVADAMLDRCDSTDVMIMTDDDINFTQFPEEGVNNWAISWTALYVCAFAFNTGNHFLRQDFKVATASSGVDFMEVTRNKGPVFAFRASDYKQTGGYDPAYYQANDVDIQQRFNMLGNSIVSDGWKYVAGTFQEGGMSAYYDVQESRLKYQQHTAKALYQLKQKYPWLWKSSVSFKVNNTTSAVYRTDMAILNEFRDKIMNGTYFMRHDGIHFNRKPMRWHLSQEDVKNVVRLQELWDSGTLDSST